MQEAYRSALLAKLASGEFTFEEVPVCLCGTPGGISLAHGDRFGIAIGVLGCPACGLLRTSPRLAAKDLPAFYESDYHGLHFGLERPAAATTLFRRGQGAAIYAFCAESLGSPRTRDRLSVVEIGAANGAVLREFASAAAADGIHVEVAGCEYSSAYAEAARELGTNVLAGGVETLVGIGLRPDLVIMSHVLEHFPDPVLDLQQVKSLLQPETLVYVEVPGLLTIHTKREYEYEFGQYLTLAHTYHFTLATLVETMGRAGFRLVRGDEEVRALFVPAPDQGSTAGDVVVAPSPPRAGRLAQTVAYLNRLDKSPALRAKRIVARARPLARVTARRLLGERGTRVVKRMLRR